MAASSTKSSIDITEDFLATLNVSVRTLLNGIKLEIEAAGVPVHFP